MVNSTKPHILLVEDSRFMATNVANTLRDAHNFHVTIAGDPTEAHELLDAYDDIACLLTNYELPETTGIELAKTITDDPATAEIPIILLTAKELEPIAAEGLEAGINEFVYKGDYATKNMDVLANRIDVVIRAYRSPELAHGYIQT